MSFYLILLPGLLGGITSFFCKVSEKSGQNVSIRPAPIVFGFVWFILYLLLGYSWFLESNNKLAFVFYSILNVLLCLWIVFYSCLNKPVSAVYILVLSMLFTLLAYTSAKNLISKLTILPLLAWLILAYSLNVIEIEKTTI